MMEEAGLKSLAVRICRSGRLNGMDGSGPGRRASTSFMQAGRPCRLRLGACGLWGLEAACGVRCGWGGASVVRRASRAALMP